MSQQHKHNIFARAWISRPALFTRWATAFVLVFLAPVANAQSMNPNADFKSLGSGMIKSVCDFVSSPLITVIVAVAFIACLVVAALNEDKGTMSKILKTVGFGLAIVMLPGVLNLVGFEMSC